MAPKNSDMVTVLLIILCLHCIFVDCKLFDSLPITYYDSSCVSDYSTALNRPNTTLSPRNNDFNHIHRSTKRKRGKRAGALVRFRRRFSRPSLPSIFLSNSRSLCNKLDELFYLCGNYRDFKECSVFCFTETWLHKNISDSSMCPPGFTPFRADRDNDLAMKKGLGGGISFLINDRWCQNSKVISKSCSPVLETLIIESRPFYSPREFSSFIFIGAYIPDSSDS